MAGVVVKKRCPHCRHMLLKAQQVNGPDDAEPIPGAIAICPFCGETSIFDEDLVLRKATETELEELEDSTEYRILRLRTRRYAREHGTRPADADDGEEEAGLAAGLYEIPLALDMDGSLRIGDIPPALREVIQPVLRQIRTQMLGEEIKQHVTPEIANYVLSAYGNEQASMPSVTVGALISLIRLCVQSDDYLLGKLYDAEGIYGYVLAVSILAENPPEGIETLELLAGLRDPREEDTKDV